MSRPQLFILSADLMSAMRHEEVKATYSDMETLNIANLPYPDLDVAIPLHEVLSGKGDPFLTKLCVLSHEGYACVKFTYRANKFDKLFIELEHPTRHDLFRDDLNRPGDTLRGLDGEVLDPARSAQIIKMYLIVLLATRGVERETHVDKMAKLGIGKRKHRYIYTTTLKIAKTLPRHDSIPERAGASRRPHLRRGHIRHQHYGPKNELRKQIWIEPCFVNGYSEETGDFRLAYNVSREKNTHVQENTHG